MIHDIGWKGEAEEIVNENNDTKIVKLTKDQMDFLDNGNIIPHVDGEYYFMPFVFKRLGSSNVFEATLMHKVDLRKVGFSKEFLTELKSSYSEIENMITPRHS